MALQPISDYTTLIAAVEAMSDRSDPEYANSIPLFIQQGETVLFSQLRCPANEKLGLFMGSMQDTRSNVQIPPDFLEARWVTYGTRPLERITDQRYLTLNNMNSTPAPPKYFARLGNSLYFYPQSTTAEDVGVQYYAVQGPLSASVPSTKLLMIAPFAYLYGALAEGARFTRDTVMEEKWQNLFVAEIARLNDQSYDNEVAGSTVIVQNLDGGW